MKKKCVIVSALLLLTIFISACGVKQPEKQESLDSQETTKTSEAATIDEIANYLIKAAKGRGETDKSALMKNLDGDKDTKATRTQAMVMVSRAFGKLPAASKAGDADLEGVPDWAAADLNNLKKGGVLTSKNFEGGADENREYIQGDGKEEKISKNNEGGIYADEASKAPNGAVEVILKDGDAKAASGETEMTGNRGCPLKDDTKEDTVKDVVEYSLSMKSAITLADVKAVVKDVQKVIQQ